MNIVITGGNSSVARALIPALAESANISTAGRDGCDIHLDVLDPVETFAIPAGTDVVINTAAHFGGSTADDMRLAVETNVNGAIKLAQACAAAGVGYLLHISTIFADIPNGSPFFSTYSLSKRQAEEWLRYQCSLSRLPLAILKPSQIYGNSSALRRHQPFLYTIIDKASNNEDIELFGTHDAMRNFIHIDDVASIISRTVKQRQVGTFACTNHTDVSYSGIAKAAIAAFGSTGSVVFLRDKQDIPDNIFPFDDRLYREISYYPQISMEQGMKMIAASRKVAP